MFVSELISSVLQVVLFSLIPFIWWLITARKKEDFFGWIGLKRINHNGKVAVTIISTLIAVLVYGLLTTFFINKFSGEVTSAGSSYAGMGLSYIPVAFVYGFIKTGLSEEILFRGFLLKRIKNKFGFVAGNLVQALAFGLVHGVPFGLATGNIGVTIILTILPGAFGFYMGYLNEKKCGSSIIPSYIIHALINTFVTIMSL